MRRRSIVETALIALVLTGCGSQHRAAPPDVKTASATVPASSTTRGLASSTTGGPAVSTTSGITPSTTSSDPPTAGGPSFTALLPDGRVVTVGAATGLEQKVLYAGSERIVGEISARTLPTGTEVYAALESSAPCSARVSRIVDGTVTDLGLTGASALVRPDGRMIAYFALGDPNDKDEFSPCAYSILTVYDLATRTEVGRWRSAGEFYEWAPDGNLVFLQRPEGAGTGALRTFDPTSTSPGALSDMAGHLAVELRPGEFPANVVAVAGGGLLVQTGCCDAPGAAPSDPRVVLVENGTTRATPVQLGLFRQLLAGTADLAFVAVRDALSKETRIIEVATSREVVVASGSAQMVA